MSNEQGLEIDIHWMVFHADKSLNLTDLILIKGVDYDKFNKMHWKNAVESTFNNFNFRMLCPEDMLIHVIVHGSKYSLFKSFRWVTDAVHIIRKYDLRWDLLIENTRKFDFNVEIYIAFHYLIKTFKLDIPAQVIEAIEKLPLTNRKIRKYYSLAKIQNLNFFIGLLIGDRTLSLWYGYWIFEAKGSFPKKCYNFLEFLAKNWGLENKKQIPLYILRKYKQRKSHYFSKQLKQ